MRTAVARSLLVAALLLGAAACGYDTSTTFNPDGSVTVSLKFLFPQSLMQGTSGATMQGLTPADIARANAQMAAKYPGATITAVTEGGEAGARITVPFKSEKDAFSFLTSPSNLNLGGAMSGSTPPGVDLSNTGGIFASATHTTSGQTDTYTFKTAPSAVTLPSPAAGAMQTVTPDELASVFSVTFSLTVPHEITSAPGALFTLDRKTAVWKVSLTTPQTFTAMTGSGSAGTGLTNAAALNLSANPAPVIGVGLLALAVGFVLALLFMRRQSPTVEPPAPPGPPAG